MRSYFTSCVPQNVKRNLPGFLVIGRGGKEQKMYDEAKIVACFKNRLADGMRTSDAFADICHGFYPDFRYSDYADPKSWRKHCKEMMRICKIKSRA